MDQQRERADEQLMEVTVDRSSRSVEHAIVAARELLGMDIAYIGQGVHSPQRLTLIQGDPGTFGVAEGAVVPWEQTFCHHVLEGRVAPLTPDVRSDPVASLLPVARTADVGVRVGPSPVLRRQPLRNPVRGQPRRPP